MDDVPEVVDALRAQQDELDALLAEHDEADLAMPSRCPGWSVLDVLVHLAQTNEAAAASVAGRLESFAAGPLGAAAVDSRDVDEWADRAVALERDAAPSEVLGRWRRSAAEQVAAFGSVDPHRTVQWVAGSMAARTLASTRLAESWVHTVDIATAWGPAPAPTSRLWHVARLAWRTLPHAFVRAGGELSGPVAFELTAPDGTRWSFRSDQEATTVVEGPAVDLCEVAGRRVDASSTELTATGADAVSVLALVRTFA